jgi:hypothetical protein
VDIRVTLADKLFPKWVTDEFMSDLIFEIEDMSDPENNLSVEVSRNPDSYHHSYIVDEGNENSGYDIFLAIENLIDEILDREKAVPPSIECVLCGNEIDVQENGWAGGHNAQPLADGQCCSNCNGLVVLARIDRAQSSSSL